MRTFKACAYILPLTAAFVSVGAQPANAPPNPLGVNTSALLPSPKMAQPYNFKNIQDWITDHWDPSNDTMPTKETMNRTAYALALPVTCMVEDMQKSPMACPEFMEYHYLMTLWEMGMWLGGHYFDYASMQDDTPQLFEPFKWFLKARDSEGVVRMGDIENVRVAGPLTAWLVAVTGRQ